jgi:hypothetical protein
MEIGFSKSFWTRLRNIVGKPKVRAIAIPFLALGLILQIYFLRELVAAELLFGLGFAFVLVLAGIFYALGALGERGLTQAEVAARAISRSARRGYIALEEFSKKTLRQSESAQ